MYLSYHKLYAVLCHELCHMYNVRLFYKVTFKMEEHFIGVAKHQEGDNNE